MPRCKYAENLIELAKDYWLLLALSVTFEFPNDFAVIFNSDLLKQGNRVK